MRWRFALLAGAGFALLLVVSDIIETSIARRYVTPAAGPGTPSSDDMDAVPSAENGSLSRHPEVVRETAALLLDGAVPEDFTPVEQRSVNGPHSHVRLWFIATGAALDAFLAEVTATEIARPDVLVPGMPEAFAERERALIAAQPRSYTMPAPLGGEVRIHTRPRDGGDKDSTYDVLFEVFDRRWDDVLDDLSDDMGRDAILESLHPPPLPHAPDRD